MKQTHRAKCLFILLCFFQTQFEFRDEAAREFKIEEEIFRTQQNEEETSWKLSKLDHRLQCQSLTMKEMKYM